MGRGAAGEVSHGARKISAWFRQSKLTFVDMVFMFGPYLRTAAMAHIWQKLFFGPKHPA